MASKADIWMPLYIGDYLAATTHLSAEESGGYLHLLMHQWKNGCLPSDSEALRRIARIEKDAWSIAWASLEHFFSMTQAGPKQERLERIRDEWQAKKDSATAKASSAAAKRWGKDAPSIAQAMPHTCPSPSPSPLKEQKTSRAKRAAHPQFAHVKDLIERYYRNHNHVDSPWGPGEAKQLSALLAEQPDAPREYWSACVVGRSRSDVNHADRPRLWIANLTSYRNAVNAFKQPKENEDGSPIRYGNLSKTERTMAAAENIAREHREAVDGSGSIPADGDGGSGDEDFCAWLGRVSTSGHPARSEPALPPGRAGGKDIDAEPWSNGHSLPSGQ